MLPCRVQAVAGPAPSEGNHVNWIDRIANLPDYAMAFYTWLEENAAPGGALADPTKGTNLNGSYVHLVHTLEATVEFEVPAGSDPGQAAQDAALSHVGNTPDIVMSYVFEAYGAFDRDHPEVFWLNTECVCGMGMEYQYSQTGSVRQVDYKLNIYFYLQSEDYDVRLEAFRSPAQITAAIGQRDQAVQRILADCPEDASVQAQIQYLNQALIQSNAYNSAVSGGDTSGADPMAWKCISALSGSTGAKGPVCEGYARAFKVLCDELNIPCVLTSGYARSTVSETPEEHMWNYVRLQGQWYAVDVTWNDPRVKSNPDAAVSGYEQDEWLLLGSQTKVADGLCFEDSHTVYNQIRTNGLCYTNGPMLAQQAYSKAENLMDVSAYRNGGEYTAPVKEGYVFAGWFTDAELTRPLDKNVKTGSAYAKFVEAETLSIKYQIKSDATSASSMTDLRLLTSVDSLDYSNVVFEVTIQDRAVQLNCMTVYERIIAGDTKIENASEIFSVDARYFVTYTLLNVPNEMFDTDITVTPQWKTLDGTVVWGAARTLRISDSLK
jgi:uncharacterized repeat protein (TIGR02543 family)